MKKILFILIIFLAFILESRITVLGASPNLTAVIAYYFGLRNGETKGMLFGMTLGIIGDGLSGGIIGPNMLGKGLVGYFSSFMSGSFFRWTPFLGMIGISVLTALDSIVVFISKSLFSHVPTSIVNAVSITLISSIINSFIGIFLRPKNE
jgi:rod shape-determining protein MreD